MAVNRDTAPVGRSDVLDQLHARLTAGESVVVYGPAGIGKSTVLAAYPALAGDALVLRANAAEVESGLPYLTLVDLFDGISGDGLPRHLRAAFDGALLRGAAPVTAQDQLAVRLATLEVLRRLAANRTVLLLVDDLQWVDPHSAGVLRFVARRLGAARVRLLGAERVESAGPRHADLCPAPVSELLLPPLTEYDTADLLRVRFGPVLSLSTIARVHEASQGNPLLAVELSRTLVARAGPIGVDQPLPVPERLRPLLAQRVASLPAQSGPVLLRAAAAARPTVALIGGDGDAKAGLEAAVEAGVATVGPDDTVRFAHPLLRELVYADAAPAARAAAHEHIAGRTDDSVERARHLALARPHTDEDLAAQLVEAATTARMRGAPAVAADLAERAAERTPDSLREVAAARRYSAAGYADAAGLTADAHRLASAALAASDDPAVRVGARLLIVDLAGQDQSAVGPVIDAAFADAGDDPGLLCRVRHYRALKAYYDGDIEFADAELKRGEEDAREAGATEQLVSLLASRSLIRGAHDPESARLLSDVASLAADLPPSTESVHAAAIYARGRSYAGDIAEATRVIEAQRDAVLRSGTLRDLSSVLLASASIYFRAGRGADALRAGRETMRLILDMEATTGHGLVAGAIGETLAGSPTVAAGLLVQAIEACSAAGDEDWLRVARAAYGQVLLFQGAPEAAVAEFRKAQELERRHGRNDPAIFLWHADFVEALAAVGELAEAAEVLTETRAVAAAFGRSVVQLGLSRAGALVRAAEGEPREAAIELAEALAEADDHPYPFEVARAWHTLATLERRAHRRGASRSALVEALAAYAAVGATPWLAAAEAELSRLDGGQGPGLSETERRIVDLVLSGATNREIARATHLSVKAIEAKLTRLYRRHGVRNRAQLTRALGGSAQG
ncbi:regulatory protein, luxR family [Asanoa hainanensis]|uniref:Regulatory protein, luxR family n=1 Tax=Asanoa hainanensis TaxID=560556 RepID=A0A239KR33_9ACTN|nr:LuxR family transcriptional regulator [Asanoa hainanensis]SNT20182.1 regulatory protein, luxR family [Asanoa hainanensis]